MNNKNTVIASLALGICFIGIIAFMTINSASYASNKNRGTSNQQNSCGKNDYLKMNIIFKIKIQKNHGDAYLIFDIGYQSFIGVCVNILVIKCNSCCCPSIANGPIAIIAKTSFNNMTMTIMTTSITTIVHSMPNTISMTYA